MSMTKTIISVLFIAASIALTPKMNHKLRKPADDVLLQHLNHVTRYEHDFSESEAGTCGQLFDIATEIFNKNLAHLTSFSEFNAMRDKSEGFLKEECRHSSGGYTWVLLKLRRNGKACDLHIPINLFNFHHNDEFSHPLFNNQYAYEALLTEDSHCYDDVDSFEGEAYRLGNINVAHFKSSGEKVDEEFSRLSQLGDAEVSKTKSERKRDALLQKELLEIKINVDQAREVVGAKGVQEYDEKINNIEEGLSSIGKETEPTFYEDLTHALKNLYDESLEFLKENVVDVKPITEDKDTPVDEKVDDNNITTVLNHFVTLAYLYNGKKDSSSVTKIPNLDEYSEIDTDSTVDNAPRHNVVSRNVQNFSQLASTFDHVPKHENLVSNTDTFSKLSITRNKRRFGVTPKDISTAKLINTPSVYYLEANGLMGGPRNCEPATKDRLIGLIHAQATATKVQGYVLYRENIVECTIAVKGGIEYTAVLYLNDDVCSHTISISPVTGVIEIVENAGLEERVKPCKSLFGFN